MCIYWLALLICCVCIKVSCLLLLCVCKKNMEDNCRALCTASCFKYFKILDKNNRNKNKNKKK